MALVAIIALWEGYKWMGQQTGDTWPGTDWGLPVPTDDLTMPPAGDIWASLWEPVQRGRDQTLASFLVESAWFTLREAALGFVIGSVVGLALAVVMLRFRSAERGLLPWVNISQTIPLIALAPIVVTWARTTWLSDTQAVALIAAYLTFFPVAVNGLRGLQSPAAADVELMRSYAAPWRTTLLKVRFPAARPYLFPAFKLAATLSVVGAIVGEISSGVKGGLGRVVLDFASRYSTGPEKLYAAVLAAAGLGLVVFGLVSAAEMLLTRGQDRAEVA
ncbi:MAG: ABC transporter permease subunit [Acidimicrobiia bacterium]|nr:ABC transporter permease subunit [Acidimicrobiia bacterium]